MSTLNDQPLPFVKWIGGKKGMLPHIKPMLPSDIGEMVYYEPFVGAGALLFDLQPHQAVIGDLNNDLINVYETIRDDVDGLIKWMRFHGVHHNAEHYYSTRDIDRVPEYLSNMSKTGRAARTLYLCRASYSGLYRVNAQGCFNAPYGWIKNLRICDEPRLRAVHRYLNENYVTIVSGDYVNAIETVDNDSFVFLDPPYHKPGNAVFYGYTLQKFDESEQLRLKDNIEVMHNKGAKVMLCNSDTEYIRALYADPPFVIHEAPVVRKVFSRKGDKARPVTELIITTY